MRRTIATVIVLAIFIIIPFHHLSAAKGSLDGFGVLQFGMTSDDLRQKLNENQKVIFGTNTFRVVDALYVERKAIQFFLQNMDLRMPCCSGANRFGVAIQSSDFLALICAQNYTNLLEALAINFGSPDLIVDTSASWIFQDGAIIRASHSVLGAANPISVCELDLWLISGRDKSWYQPHKY